MLGRGASTLILICILYIQSAFTSEETNNFSELIPQISSPTIIGGVVDVITGKFVLPDVQLRKCGPAPYAYDWHHTHSRIALRGGFANGFDSSTHAYTLEYKDWNKKNALTMKLGQNTILFTGKLKQNQLKPDKTSLDTWCNIFSGALSARTNPNNNKVDITNFQKPNYRLRITRSDGKTQFFESRKGYLKNYPYIKSETLPSGNCIHYSYTDDQAEPSMIFATNKDRSKTFWIIDASINPETQTTHTVTDNKGSWVKYFTKNGRFITLDITVLERIECSDRPPVIFEGYKSQMGTKGTIFYDTRIRRVRRPDHRLIEFEYDEGEKVSEIRQQLSLGYCPAIYRFEHHDKKDNYFWNKPTEGHTDVFDGNGYKSIFRYTMKDPYGDPLSAKKVRPHRFMSIEQFRKGGALEKKVNFCWADDKTVDKGRLRFKADIGRFNGLVEGFEYDKAGNVTTHSLYGNLTKIDSCNTYSLLNNPFTKPDKNTKRDWEKHLSHLDCYRRTFKHVNDKFNLLASVRDDFGNHINYYYFPGTDLIHKKITIDGEHDAIVQIYDYNYDKVMVKEETITPVYHIIKEIKPVEDPGEYGFGLPEIVTEYAADENGKKTLLKETKFAYTIGDKVTKEEVYDCSGDYCYAKEYFYDKKSRLVAEINPMGEETRYEYDENFNKISEEVIGSGLKIFYDYDLGNRLIAKRLVSESGEVLEIKYEYDVMNNLIKVIDQIKGVTKYYYDCQGNRVKEITEPLILPDGSKKDQIRTFSYDGIGNAMRFIDQNGALTLIKRTSTGLPLETEFPDKTKETCVYREDGKLLEKHLQGGESQYYDYDNLGHKIFQRTVEATAEIDFVEEWQFSGDRLVKNIDRNGNIILFNYDKAGRLIEELANGSDCEKRVTYGYDTLGRRYSVTRWLSDAEYISQETKVDYLGREVLLRQSNEKGETLSLEEYEYDWQGNVTCKKRHIDENQTSIELWNYNAFGHVISYTDPFGNQTITHYDYSASDDLGRKGLLKTTCDPLGKVTMTLTGAGEKILETHELDPGGNIISHSKVFYDSAGNKIHENYEVFQDVTKIRDYSVSRNYDCMNRLLNETEQPGTKDEKITAYEYDSDGRLAKIIQPNGTELNLLTTKDQLVMKRSSSDGVIDEEWFYDSDFNPILVRSGDTYTKRVYDSFGRMVYEQLANGLEICFKYDSLDRIQKIIYPDGGCADYDWIGGRFSHVKRYLSDDTLAYHYSQGDYNLLGRHLKASLPGVGNTISYTFDLMGRPTNLKNKHFSQCDVVYNEVGSLVSFTEKDVFGETPYAFTYDSWYHLATESGRFNRTYCYDSLGNRTTKNQSEYSINPLNQVKNAEGTIYEYDKNGCLIKKTEEENDFHFTYDALNRLTKITKSSEEKHFFYDPFNRRIAESLKPISDPQLAVKRYLFDDEKEIAVFNIGQSANQLRILLPGTSEIGATLAIELNGVPYAPLNSIHGHISGLVTMKGELAGAWHYSSFGEEEALENSVSCTWRSWNKPTEELTGYVFFGRRFYDTILGRWVTPDPEGFTDGPNLYAYVHNKPLTYFDHFGLFTECSFFDPESSLRCGHDWMSSDAYRRGVGCEQYYWQNAFDKNYVNLYYGGPRIISLREGLSMISDRVDPNFKINDIEDKVLVLTNGIWTKPKDAMYHLYTLCKAGNCNGYLLYNPDHNRKLAECFAYRNGNSTPTTDLLRDFFTGLVEKNPNIHILSSYHSEGGLINNVVAGQLSPEVKKHIFFFGVAPANIVPNDGCLGCFNLVSEWDTVPWFSSKNLRTNPDIVKFIRHPKCDSITAHSFDNPIYDEFKERTIIDFMNK